MICLTFYYNLWTTCFHLFLIGKKCCANLDTHTVTACLEQRFQNAIINCTPNLKSPISHLNKIVHTEFKTIVNFEVIMA